MVNDTLKEMYSNQNMFLNSDFHGWSFEGLC
jgi:hypothetical protein